MNNKPEYRYLPPHAIWFQTTPSIKACISVVNNIYKYEAFNKVTGVRIHVGNARKFSTAKNHIFKYLQKA